MFICFAFINYNLHLTVQYKTWGCSSNGRALALHARGTGFDPLHLHLFFFCLNALPSHDSAVNSVFSDYNNQQAPKKKIKKKSISFVSVTLSKKKSISFGLRPICAIFEEF